jgi:hypothetical protein
MVPLNNSNEKVSNGEYIQSNNYQNYNIVKTLFSVLIVSAFLTIYEILMLYVFMIPEVKKQIDDGIIKLSLTCKNTVNDLIDNALNDINNTNGYNQYYIYLYKYIDLNNSTINLDLVKYNILSIFKTYEQRENILINKLKIYNIFTSCILLFILFFSIFLIIYYLKKNNQIILDKYVWISIITIIFILLFQYIFFIYANNYNYIGSQNEIEIVYFVMSIL